MKKFPYIRAAFRFAVAEIVHAKGQEDAAASLLYLHPKNLRLTRMALNRILKNANAEQGPASVSQEERLRRLTRATTVAGILDQTDHENVLLTNDLRYHRNAAAAELAEKNPAAVSAIYKRFASDADYIQARFEEAKTETKALKALDIYLEVSRNTKGACSDIAAVLAMNWIDDAAKQNRDHAYYALKHLAYVQDPSVSFRATHKLGRLGDDPHNAPWPFGEGPFAASRVEPQKPAVLSETLGKPNRKDPIPRKNDDGHYLH